MRFVYAVVFAVLSCVSPLMAQNAVPTYKPNQTITLSITFQGPDASKIKSAQWVANASALQPNQPSFSQQLDARDSKPGASPNTFDVSIKVGEEQATGEYEVQVIRAITDNPPLNLYYSGTDVPARKFRVENSLTFTKPSIKDVKVLP